MKTGVLCVAVLTALAAQQTSAAFRNSCFGGRCGFRSGNNRFGGIPSRFGQSRGGFSPRFGPARSPFGPSPSRFGTSSSAFSSSGRFGPSSRGFGHFSSSSSHFSSSPGQFGPGQRRFISASSQFGSPPGQFGRFNRFRSSFQQRLAGATPDQRFQAQLAAGRQLAQRRRHEQHQLRTRTGLLQPGSPAAALAAEKRADPKSLALGNQALQQILYLQNLVGAGRRR